MRQIATKVSIAGIALAWSPIPCRADRGNDTPADQIDLGDRIRGAGPPLI